MLNVNDIITIKDNREYIIIDKEYVNDIQYLLVDKVDKNEELMDKYQILKVTNKYNKLIVNTIKNETELAHIKLIFLKKLENKENI